MRILMTSDTYLPRMGGGEYHVYYLARELHQLGHGIRLFVTEHNANTDTDPWVTIRTPYHGWKSILPIAKQLWSEAKLVDLIHSHYSYRLATISAVVALLQRKPFIITQHGLGLLPQAGAKWWQKILLRIMRYISQKNATVIISTSEDLSVDIRALGFAKKIVPITNGYDDQLFRPLQPPTNTNPVLVTIRRLVPKNGIQYLIAALPELRQKFPSLHYIAVGDGRLKDDLVALAQTLGVTDMITFAGAATHAQIIDYYSQAHVVVIPSTAESTSLSCIEAMALQKPIVASRVGGLIELIGANEERGWLVRITPTEHCDYHAPMQIESSRITSLALAISEALTQGDLIHKKTSAAAVYARTHFPWTIIAKKTEDAYKKALLSLPA